MIWTTIFGLKLNNPMFKGFTYGVFICVFLHSCTTVYFDRPQPRDGKILEGFPDEILNVWSISENQGRLEIEFKLNALVITEYEKDSISNDMVVGKRSEIALGDSIILKHCKSFYALSLKEKENQYQIACLVLNEEDEVSIYAPQKLPFWKSSRRLKLDSVQVSNGSSFMGAEESRMQKNFDLNEGEEINNVYYSGSLKSKHLKKMIRKENLIMTLTSGGEISFQ